jgi:hypothetical protein
MSIFGGPDIVTDGLVLHLDAANRKSYPLSGSTIYDLSGNGNNGTFGASTAAPTFSGDNGGGLTFNGDDRIDNNNFTLHQINAGTLEWWVKTPSVLATLMYIGGVGGTTTYGATRVIRVWNGMFSLVHYGGGTNEDWNSIISVSTNTLYHLVQTWNGISVSLYINNIGYSNTRSGLITPTGTNLSLGISPFNTSAFWIGRIYTMRLYNKALNELEIEQNYNALKGRYGL